MAVIMLDGKGQVTLWNKVAVEMFGWSAEEVIGRCLPIVPSHMLDDFWENFNKLIDGGSFSGLERLCLKKNGENLDISIAASPVRDTAPCGRSSS